MCRVERGVQEKLLQWIQWRAEAWMEFNQVKRRKEIILYQGKSMSRTLTLLCAGRVVCDGVRAARRASRPYKKYCPLSPSGNWQNWEKQVSVRCKHSETLNIFSVGQAESRGVPDSQMGQDGAISLPLNSLLAPDMMPDSTPSTWRFWPVWPKMGPSKVQFEATPSPFYRWRSEDHAF